MVQPSTVATANSGDWNDVPILLHPLRHALDGKIITGFFTTEDTVQAYKRQHLSPGSDQILREVRDRGDSAKMPFEFPLGCCCIP